MIIPSGGPAYKSHDALHPFHPPFAYRSIHQLLSLVTVSLLSLVPPLPAPLISLFTVVLGDFRDRGLLLCLSLSAPRPVPLPTR